MTETTDDVFGVGDFERDVLEMGISFYEHGYKLVLTTTRLLAAVNTRFEELTPAKRERMDYRKWAYIRPAMSSDDPRRPLLPWCRYLDSCTALLWEMVEHRRFREGLNKSDKSEEHPPLPKHLPLPEETMGPKFYRDCFCVPRSLELMDRAVCDRMDKATDQSEWKCLDRWHELLSRTSKELEKLFNDKTFRPQIMASLAEQQSEGRPRLH